MRNHLISLIFYACLLVTVQGCYPNEQVSLSVNKYYQQTDEWCWAASGQMIMDYFGHNTLQCTQANERFGRSDCCSINLCPSTTDPPLEDVNGNCLNCTCGGWPEFDKYGFTFRRTSGKPLTWKQVKQQISSPPAGGNKPFAFTWEWNGGGAHMMIVTGFTVQAGKRYVEIIDPMPPCIGGVSLIAYKYYRASLFHHSHSDDFYDITYTGGN